MRLTSKSDRLRLGVGVFFALGASCSLGTAEASATTIKDCGALLGQDLGQPNLNITVARSVTDDTAAPAYCLVQGKVDRRKGVDGKDYAISFELRLPVAWNRRFLYQLNGSNDGVVLAAIGDSANLRPFNNISALARGFAVLSTDSGHNGSDPSNASPGLTQGQQFGRDPEARSDYGYQAEITMGPIAKKIIEAHYGLRPDYSYMYGCSNGGRHVMVGAVRLAEQYDGFIAGDPGFNLPKAAVQSAWNVQSLMTANPDIRKSFSRNDTALIARKVLDACDGLDGAADGIVSDIKACQKVFHIESLQCTGAKTDECLSPQQIAALKRMMAGPINTKGEQLYSGWPYDAGMGANNWRTWNIESTIPGYDGYPLIAIADAAALSYIFTTPPTPTEGNAQALLAYMQHFDFDRDAPKISAKGRFVVDGVETNFVESAIDFMSPPDVDDPKLSALRAAGHKLIIYHGQSDGIFSFNDTADWYEKLDANNHGTAASFARLFAVPNMNHCSGGPATDTFDALSAMVNWVENGQAPDQMLATVSPANAEIPTDWSKTRTRPLCAWPKVSHYVGGDKEKASSFVCQ